MFLGAAAGTAVGAAAAAAAPLLADGAKVLARKVRDWVNQKFKEWEKSDWGSKRLYKDRATLVLESLADFARHLEDADISVEVAAELETAFGKVTEHYEGARKSLVNQGSELAITLKRAHFLLTSLGQHEVAQARADQAARANEESAANEENKLQKEEIEALLKQRDAYIRMVSESKDNRESIEKELEATKDRLKYAEEKAAEGATKVEKAGERAAEAQKLVAKLLTESEETAAKHQQQLTNVADELDKSKEELEKSREQLGKAMAEQAASQQLIEERNEKIRQLRAELERCELDCRRRAAAQQHCGAVIGALLSFIPGQQGHNHMFGIGVLHPQLKRLYNDQGHDFDALVRGIVRLFRTFRRYYDGRLPETVSHQIKVNRRLWENILRAAESNENDLPRAWESMLSVMSVARGYLDPPARHLGHPDGANFFEWEAIQTAALPAKYAFVLYRSNRSAQQP